MAYCKQCGSRLADGAKFCKFCGYRIPAAVQAAAPAPAASKLCRQCGAQLADGMKFCKSCGAPTSVPTAAPTYVARTATHAAPAPAAPAPAAPAPVASTKKFCRKCGAQLIEGTKFCKGCGAPVPAAAQTARNVVSTARQVASVAQRLVGSIVNEVEAPATAGEMVLSTWQGL